MSAEVSFAESGCPAWGPGRHCVLTIRAVVIPYPGTPAWTRDGAPPSGSVESLAERGSSLSRDWLLALAEIETESRRAGTMSISLKTPIEILAMVIFTGFVHAGLTVHEVK